MSGGGKYKDQLNKLLKTYTELNIKVDEQESNNNAITVLFFTIDDKNICLMLLIDRVEQFSTISDLKNYPNCIQVASYNVIGTLIKVSAQISTDLNMTHMQLSDRSYYTCKGYQLLLYLLINPYKKY
jgi:hypothetical protein